MIWFTRLVTIALSFLAVLNWFEGDIITGIALVIIVGYQFDDWFLGVSAKQG